MFVIEAFYFFLPAMVANMMPVLVKKVPFLNVPISRRYLGGHKTWRGFVFGVLGGILVAWLQMKLDLLDVYLGESFVLYGGLMGFGSLLGDSVKSFFKRRVGKKSGEAWFPFDQLDFVIGGLVLISFYVGVKPEYAVVLLLAMPVLHRLINELAFKLGLKEVPY